MPRRSCSDRLLHTMVVSGLVLNRDDNIAAWCMQQQLGHSPNSDENKSYLEQTEGGLTVLHLLSTGDYEELKTRIKESTIKKKHTAVLDRVYENIEHLKNELQYGNHPQASDGFKFLVETFLKKFHVGFTHSSGIDCLELLVGVFRCRMAGPACHGQHCKALLFRADVLIENGLKTNSTSFNKLFLYLCFEDRYLLQDRLCRLRELRNPHFRADLGILELLLAEISAANEAQEIVDRFPNYIQWCLLLMEKTTSDTAAKIILNLAKLSRSEAMNHSLCNIPEEVFTQMTCDGHTIYSMAIMTENAVVFEELISREMFDPRRIIWRESVTSKNSYMHRVTDAEERSACRSHKMGMPMTSNTLEEVLRKRWLCGMDLLKNHIKEHDREAYIELLFKIISSRWSEGLRVFCKKPVLVNGMNCEEELSLDPVNSQGLGLLHHALEQRWVHGSTQLIENMNLNVNLRDQRGLTAVHIAMDNEDWEMVLEILQKRKDDVEVDSTDCNCRMLIHKALFKGQTQIIKVLLNFPKLDLLSRDKDGNPPLHSAVLDVTSQVSCEDVELIMRSRHFNAHVVDSKGCNIADALARTEGVRNDLKEKVLYELGMMDARWSFRRTLPHEDSAHTRYFRLVKEAIRRKRSTLLENIPPRAVLDTWFEDEVINNQVLTEIDSLFHATDKNRRILQILFQKPELSFESFLVALKRAEYDWLSDELQDYIEDRVDECEFFRRRRTESPFFSDDRSRNQGISRRRGRDERRYQPNFMQNFSRSASLNMNQRRMSSQNSTPNHTMRRHEIDTDADDSIGSTLVINDNLSVSTIGVNTSPGLSAFTSDHGYDMA
ncbi:hypothetical protein CAPTEDRAFT_206533 [Capitella teleta]|uniref:CARD domain-containing protein n=1 Tax=Capitella teleta TaxID=283909 RepID=R7U144_CAPTE|nr:hypothetical protein CAPTEDRAFT_206533 [Capitella teleta]|eukprot:ELT99928.1 hypothetical protein CAPTEDRAFT_206533 [Capitella teleta]